MKIGKVICRCGVRLVPDTAALSRMYVDQTSSIDIPYLCEKCGLPSEVCECGLERLRVR